MVGRQAREQECVVGILYILTDQEAERDSGSNWAGL